MCLKSFLRTKASYLRHYLLSDDSFVEGNKNSDSSTCNDTLPSTSTRATNSCHALQINQATKRHILRIDRIRDQRFHNVEGEGIERIRESGMVATRAASQVEKVAEEQWHEEASCSPEERRLPEARREQEEEIWEADRVWRIEEEWDSWDSESVAIFQDLRTKVVGLEEESQGLDADNGGEGFTGRLCGFNDTAVLDGVGDFVADDGGAELDGVGDDGG